MDCFKKSSIFREICCGIFTGSKICPSLYQGFFSLLKLHQHKFVAGDPMANCHLKMNLNLTKLKSYSVYDKEKKMYEAIPWKINLQIVSLDDYT
jgi:hypothetical protein